MESQSRACGDEGRSNVWTLGTTQTRQSAMMKRVAFSFPPLRPSMSSHIPFKPHCTLLHCPAWPARHLPRSYMRPHPALSPLRIVSVHIVGWRTEAEIDFTEGKYMREVGFGVESNLCFCFCCSCFLSWSSDFWKIVAVWICCHD